MAFFTNCKQHHFVPNYVHPNNYYPTQINLINHIAEIINASALYLHNVS